MSAFRYEHKLEWLPPATASRERFGVSCSRHSSSFEGLLRLWLS